MGCYCGCGTTANKIRWILGSLFMTLGVAFLIATLVVVIQSYNDYSDCVDNLRDAGLITKSQADDAKEFENWDETNDNPLIEKCRDEHLEDGAVSALFWLMVGFFVAGSIQFYIMCCCAKKPGECGPATQVYYAQPQPGYAQPQPSYGQPVYNASNIQMSKV